MLPINPAETIALIESIQDARAESDRWARLYSLHAKSCPSCQTKIVRHAGDCLKGHCLKTRYVESWKKWSELKAKYAERKALEKEWEVTG